MICVTTATIEGKRITRHLGVVGGEAIMGANFIRDWLAEGTDVFGGRSGVYEEVVDRARNAALKAMEERARKMGGHAVIGVRVDIGVLGEKNGMIMASVAGTAVCTELANVAPEEESLGYWVKVDGVERGPFTRAQLQELIAGERIGMDSPCRIDGHEKWQTCGTLLFP